MAKVLATKYRTSKVNDKGQLERTEYSPGEKPEGIPAAVKKQLEEDGLLVDEDLLDDNGNRLSGDSVIQKIQAKAEEDVAKAQAKAAEEAEAKAKAEAEAAAKAAAQNKK